MNAMQEALLKVIPKESLDSASDIVHTLKISRSAIQGVKNPLPIPLICPHCAGNVTLVNNIVIYRTQSYGNWPYAYMCSKAGCHAYVGLHPYTTIPLGTLATAPMRDARVRAKAAFEPLWKTRQMSRSQAYKWLANQLGIKNSEECHIGWFDVAMCKRVIIECQNYKE